MCAQGVVMALGVGLPEELAVGGSMEDVEGEDDW